MFANRYTALIDACCLAGALRRNLLLSLAEAEFFRPVWSEVILEEARIAIARILTKHNKNSLEAEQKSRQHISAIRTAFPEAEIAAFEDLLGVGSHLPDRDDAHVLAAAIKSQAATIITDNLDDFPTNIL